MPLLPHFKHYSHENYSGTYLTQKRIKREQWVAWTGAKGQFLKGTGLLKKRTKTKKQGRQDLQDTACTARDRQNAGTAQQGKGGTGNGQMAIKKTTIKQEIYFEATPDEVYETLVDEKKHSEVTGAAARGTAKEGGKFSAWGGYIFGKNLKLVKGKKIVQEWTTTDWPSGAGPSRLTLTLKAKNGGTMLKMVHSNLPAEQAEMYGEGWKDNYWELMKKHFESRKRQYG